MTRPSPSAFIDPANLISLVGLCAGAAAVLFAAQSVRDLPVAIVALCVAGLCDLLDGLVARRLTRDEQAQTFGRRLDSLVDACAFGLAPCMLFLAAGMSGFVELALILLYLCCAVWRLAYFDTVGIDEDADGRRAYRGVPTTMTSLVVALTFLVGIAGKEPLRIAANVAAIGLAIGFVSPIRFPKPGLVGSIVLGVIGVVMIPVWLLIAMAGFPR